MSDNNSSDNNQGIAIDTIVLGLAPAIAIGSTYNTIAWHTNLAMSNAVYAQQMGYSSMQCATALSVQKLLCK